MQSHNPAMIEVSHYEVIDYKSDSLMHEIGRNVTLYYLQELSFSDKVSDRQHTVFSSEFCKFAFPNHEIE